MISLGCALISGAGLAQAEPNPPLANPVVNGAAPSVSIAAPSANINITPRRVVFDAIKRTEAVFVFNQGTAPVTVDVSLIDNVMLPTGEIVPVDKLAERSQADQTTAAKLKSARDLILASPSRLTLPPGKGRTIRLRASLPAGADSAELRTHLAVTTVPAAESGLTAEAAATPRAGELAFKIQSVFGISIPLILRPAPINPVASISGMKVEMLAAPVGPTGELRRVPVLSFTLARSGAGSIFGNIEAKSTSGKSNEIIGYVRGLGVYPELDSRRVDMPLTRMPHSGETIAVTFISDDPQLPKLRASGTMIAP
ncbi:MAG: hypothetical protein ACKOW1_05130 [Novosphingobium sp.]